MKTKLGILRPLVPAVLAIGVIGSTGCLFAGSLAIGMAVANGSFRVDHSRVWGNSTLFSGSVIETATASSQLQLNGGAQVRLAANTRATIYPGKLVLESGYGQLESWSGLAVEARSLNISSLTPDSVARIRLDADRKVTVAAVRGAVRVANSSGLLVARVEPGSSLDFEPQVAGAAAPTRVSGCVLVKAGKIVLADQTTNVILELDGRGLEAEVGNRVEITGRAEGTTPNVAGASESIAVVGMKEVSKGGCSAIAKKLGASAVVVGTAAGAAGSVGAAGVAGTAGAAGAAGAATTAGIGLGTIAVIGGVATAATVGGLAAVGALPGQSETTPTVSR